MAIGRSLLLTGSGGFLGSHLRQALSEVALFPQSSELDLLDLHAVRSYLTDHDVKTIIHAAGYVGGIGLNKAHPGRMIAENLRMGANVLQAAAERPGTHVCIVSTVCVYPSDAATPTPETAMYDGYPAEDTAFYGIAKRTLHTMAEGMRREFGMTFSYVIPTNLYGPGDHFDEAKSHVVPALIRRVLEAKEGGVKQIIVWGDGSQTRDLLYVEDAVKGIIASLRPEGHNQVFNLGFGREVSVKELATTICSVVGFEGELVWDTTKPGGAPRRALDSTKAREKLGFCPSISLLEGLTATYRWYLENRKQLT